MLQRIAPRSWLRIDAAGAAVSFVALAGVLAPGHLETGLPPAALRALAAGAAIFCLVAAASSVVATDPRRPLRLMATLNLAYTVVAGAICLAARHDLTAAGLVYVLVEIGIVVPLAAFELRAAR